jgi:hypothetical protein
VKDYPSSDKFTAVLADTQRQRVYLAAKSQIDVFSTNSNQYTAPMYPAAQGAAKQFSGLAVTPDGSQLIATDLLDGSIAVVNLDAPSSTFAVPIAPVEYSTNNCAKGPMYVATTSDHRAFVTTAVCRLLRALRRASFTSPICRAEQLLSPLQLIISVTSMGRRRHLQTLTQQMRPQTETTSRWGRPSGIQHAFTRCTKFVYDCDASLRLGSVHSGRCQRSERFDVVLRYDRKPARDHCATACVLPH